MGVGDAACKAKLLSTFTRPVATTRVRGLQNSSVKAESAVRSRWQLCGPAPALGILY